MYKVEGNPTLVRDPKTGAVLNCSLEAHRRAMIARERIKQTKQQQRSLEQKVEVLSRDMEEIKELLKLALNK